MFRLITSLLLVVVLASSAVFAQSMDYNPSCPNPMMQEQANRPKVQINWQIDRNSPLPQLSWQSEDEGYTERFELQASNDGLFFQTLDSFAAKGDGSDYFFIDHHLGGVAQRYYRLLALDSDGQVETVLSCSWINQMAE